MTPDEIPREYKELLDDAAGKRHSFDGPVMECLAEILTRHREAIVGEFHAGDVGLNRSIRHHDMAAEPNVDAEQGELGVPAGGQTGRNIRQAERLNMRDVAIRRAERLGRSEICNTGTDLGRPDLHARCAGGDHSCLCECHDREVET